MCITWCHNYLRTLIRIFNCDFVHWQVLSSFKCFDQSQVTAHDLYEYALRLPYDVFTVERLREHWDEANAKVIHRRNHLDDMLLESRQLEEKKEEIERMRVQWEEECDQWEEPGVTTEKLEKQMQEQKVRIDQSLSET